MNSITVAVSTFREGYLDWMMQLLDSLNNQTLRDFEVLLVVNRNRRYFNRLAAKIKETAYTFDVKAIYNPHERGIAFARNIALNSAITPYIVFTDDDVILQSDWIKKVKETFANANDAGAVTGPILANWCSGAVSSGEWFPKELYWVIGCTNRELTQIKEVRNGFASNLALDRKAALSCGGFNESFGYNQKHRMAGEEPELCLRMKKKGKLTVWNPELVVYHRIPPNRLKLSNIVVRSYIEGRTKAHLKKILGYEATTVETEHMQSVVKALFLSKTLRSKAYLATSTSAVAAGYFFTNLNMRRNNLAQNVPRQFNSQGAER
jgi:glucosyl-dolichyl phosphate glucuronosyltransferase